MTWQSPDSAERGVIYIAWVVGMLPSYQLLANNSRGWERESDGVIFPREIISAVHKLPSAKLLGKGWLEKPKFPPLK